jgi:hypothetical protein
MARIGTRAEVWFSNEIASADEGRLSAVKREVTRTSLNRRD